MTRHVAAALLDAVAVAVALGSAEPAFAEPVDGDDSARAEYLFREGVAAYASDRYYTAIDLFGTADRLRPRPELAFDIARSYEKLGNDSGALGFYREYLRRAGHPSDEADVERRIALFESRLAERGVQQARIASTPPGAAVIVDGAELGRTPLVCDLRPGSHRLLVRLEGYEDWARRFELPERKATDIAVVLSPEAQPLPVREDGNAPVRRTEAPRRALPDPDGSPRGGTLTTLGWVGLGAAAAALGGAVVVEVLREKAESDAAREKEQIQFEHDVHAMETDRTAARVLAGAGAALAVTGGVFLIFGANASESRERPRVSVRVTPTSLAAGASLRF